MNKKLSLIILFLLFISLLSVLLAFLAFSKDSGSNQDVGELKTGYEQLSKQVSELKVTTKELDTKVSSNTTSSTTDTTATTTPAQTTPAQTTEQMAEQNTTQSATTTPQLVTKTISGSKVNMRAVASTTGKIVRQVTLGEAVTLTGSTFSSDGYQWVQVKDAKGNTGWLVASYLK